MTSFKNNSLAWESAPFAALLRLAWPILISMLSVSTLTLVDTLFVSRLGPAAIAGVGLSGVLTFSFWCFPMGVVRAVKILVSHDVGASVVRPEKPHLSAALVAAVAFGLVTTALVLVAAPWLPSFTETVESGQHATVYLSARAWGTVPFLALIAIQETRYGLGDSRSIMFTTLAGNLTNIALDYTFIFVFGWGVAGAAWASNAALCVELLLLCLVHWRKTGFDLFPIRIQPVLALLRLGIPSGLQFGLEVTSFGVMVLILSSFSEQHTAAHQIGIQVLHFAFLPAFAFGEAGSVLAGQAVGAGRVGLVYGVARNTLLMAMVYASVCGTVFFVFARHIVGVFTHEPELFELTVNLFAILAVFQFFDAANIVLRSILRGTGDVRYVAIVGIAAAWCCTPPLTYILGRTLGFGLYGAWIGVSAEVLIATLILGRRLATGRFERASTVGTPAASASSA